MATALPEGDRERIVKCQGASSPRAWTGADRSDLVQLGGRPVAIGKPATNGTCLIGESRAKIPAATFFGLRPQDSPRCGVARGAKPIGRGPHTSVSGPRIQRISDPAGA